MIVKDLHLLTITGTKHSNTLARKVKPTLKGVGRFLVCGSGPLVRLFPLLEPLLALVFLEIVEVRPLCLHRQTELATSLGVLVKENAFFPGLD